MHQLEDKPVLDDINTEDNTKYHILPAICGSPCSTTNLCGRPYKPGSYTAKRAHPEITGRCAECYNKAKESGVPIPPGW